MYGCQASNSFTLTNHPSHHLCKTLKSPMPINSPMQSSTIKTSFSLCLLHLHKHLHLQALPASASSPSSPFDCSSCSSRSSYSSRSSCQCSSCSPACSPSPTSPLASEDRATPSNPCLLKRAGPEGSSHSGINSFLSQTPESTSMGTRALVWAPDWERAPVRAPEFQLGSEASPGSSRRRQIRPRHPIPPLDIGRIIHSN